MKEYSAILDCIPHHTNMTSAPTVSTLSSRGDYWTPRRTSNYNYDELGPSDEPRKKPSHPTNRFSTHTVPKYETLFIALSQPQITRSYYSNSKLFFFFFKLLLFFVCVFGRRLNALLCCIGFLFYFLQLAGMVLANSSFDIALLDTF